MPSLAFIGFTVASILAGASGAHAVQSPKAWPQDWGGFSDRVADRTGFVTVKLGVRGATAWVTGIQDDDTPCARRGLLRCAVHRSFTGIDRNGVRRAHVPMLLSVAVGSATSIAWRPERKDPQTAAEFAGTRALVSLGFTVAERIVTDWFSARPR